MLSVFSIRQQGINFLKNNKFFFFGVPIFRNISRAFFFMVLFWFMFGIGLPCNIKPDSSFSFNKESKFVHCDFMLDQNLWSDDIPNGVPFVMRQAFYFLGECSSKFSSGIVEVFSPVSALAEDVGDNSSEKSGNGTDEQGYDIGFVHFSLISKI